MPDPSIVSPRAVGGTPFAMWRALGRLPLARILVTASAALAVVAVDALPIVSLSIMFAGGLVMILLERHLPASPYAARN